MRIRAYLAVSCFMLASPQGIADLPSACQQAADARAYAQVIEHCHASAEAGEAEAAFMMGQAYEYIQDPRRSGSVAAGWYRQAAEQGHPLAQRNLGALYDSGFGVPKDPWHAFQWYMKAARQQQPHSELMVGMMYLDGIGTQPDRDLGLYWLERAAVAGEANAQYMFGKLFFDDHPDTAIRWYRKAAAQDNAYALYRLGLLHYRGEHLPEDDRQAMQLARRARQLGHPRAEILMDRIRSRSPDLVADSTDPSAAGTDRQQAPLASSQRSPKSEPSPQTPTQPDKPTPPAPANPPAQQTVAAAPVPKSSDSPPVPPQSRQPRPSAGAWEPADQANWLLQQPAAHFSIQLAQMSQLTSVRRFFKRYGLKDQARVYRSQFKSGPRYVIIYGDYDSLKQARQSLEGMPAKVRALKPWIRSFARLQRDYRPPTP